MKYKVACDGWWKTAYGDAILTKDIITVFNEDEDFYYLEVKRLGKWFGNLKISKMFLGLDFEVIKE